MKKHLVFLLLPLMALFLAGCEGYAGIRKSQDISWIHEGQPESGLPVTTDRASFSEQYHQEGFAQGSSIHLPSVRGEILRVKSPKGWDPKNPESCASIHLIPVRSTGEGGPKDKRFAHKKIETVCLNPGTDLFDLENADNGFVKASIAVKNPGEFSYELLQRLALDSMTVGYTTEGDPVIRAYVFFTDKHYGRWQGPPKVALNPFGGTSGRHEFEENVYSGRLHAYRGHDTRSGPVAMGQSFASGDRCPRANSSELRGGYVVYVLCPWENVGPGQNLVWGRGESRGKGLITALNESGTPSTRPHHVVVGYHEVSVGSSPVVLLINSKPVSVTPSRRGQLFVAVPVTGRTTVALPMSNATGKMWVSLDAPRGQPQLRYTNPNPQRGAPFTKRVGSCGSGKSELGCDGPTTRFNYRP